MRQSRRRIGMYCCCPQSATRVSGHELSTVRRQQRWHTALYLGQQARTRLRRQQQPRCTAPSSERRRWSSAAGLAGAAHPATAMMITKSHRDGVAPLASAAVAAMSSFERSSIRQPLPLTSCPPCGTTDTSDITSRQLQMAMTGCIIAVHAASALCTQSA